MLFSISVESMYDTYCYRRYALAKKAVIAKQLNNVIKAYSLPLETGVLALNTRTGLASVIFSNYEIARIHVKPNMEIDYEKSVSEILNAATKNVHLLGLKK